MLDFSLAWLTGSTSHQTINVLGHAKSEQHIASMGHLQEERARAQDIPTTSYAPIARVLMQLWHWNSSDHVLAMLNLV